VEAVAVVEEEEEEVEDEALSVKLLSHQYEKLQNIF
jgi:hypothetical protein